MVYNIGCLLYTSGYNPNLINKLHRHILNKNNKTKNTNNTQPNKYITLTYYNSNTHKIANTFRKHNYKIAYRTNNRVRFPNFGNGDN